MRKKVSTVDLKQERSECYESGDNELGEYGLCIIDDTMMYQSVSS